MWPLLAVGTAVFYALNGAWSARVSRSAGAVGGAWALFAFAAPMMGTYLLVRGMPEVSPGFWPAWSAAVVGNLVAWSLFFASLRSGDLGITYPLLALTPVFVVPVEWVLLDELPSAFGLSGIGLVVVGVYFLNFRRASDGPLGPIAAIVRDRSARQALTVALIWSVTGTLDRVAVLESSPAFYGFMLPAGLSVLFVPLVLRAASRSPGTEGWRRVGACGAGVLVVHGLFFAAMIALQMEALTLERASYVLSIKRSGAVVAVLIGYFAFAERDLGSRLLGTVVTLAGATVLVLMG